MEPTADDHLAFTFNGDVDGYVAWAALPEMEDTGWHDMSVVVAAPRSPSASTGPYIDTTVNDGDAYVGFTAAPAADNTHLIDSLSVTETVCRRSAGGPGQSGVEEARRRSPSDSLGGRPC